MSKTIYWHLPGFCYFKLLNITLIDLLKKYPSCFYDGYTIGSVYGTFPGAIWNGGRTVLGFTSKNDVQRTLKEYNSRNIPVRFTWTNPLIGEDETKDSLCNMIMTQAQNGMNQVLVNSPVLESYLREKYPDFKYVSSTTKRIIDSGALQEELKKDYFMVVLDYDLNHDEAVLKSLEPDASRVEILVDEICFPNCPKRMEHYRDEGEKQLQFEVAPPFECPNRQQKKRFQDCMKRPAFISKETMAGYIDRGFENFKLVGRGLPMDLVLESYLYYLVKEEEQEFIRREITRTLQDAQMKRAAQRR